MILLASRPQAYQLIFANQYNVCILDGWNLAYSHMMARVVKRPLVPVMGEKWALFAVFTVSGLLHELAITVPVGAGYGLPTLFFLIHGLAACLERKNSGAMAFLCGVLLVVGLPLLFPGEFVREVIWPSRDVFLKLISLRI